MSFSIGSIPFFSSNKKQQSYLKLPHSDPNTVGQLSEQIRLAFSSVPSFKQIVVVCVGTDRSTGDALGPLVGSSLSKHGQIPVYGTLDEPVHAINLAEKLKAIQQKHQSPYILAVDACLGQLSSVGYIQAGTGPVKPGAGVNKDLPPVGDFHITGIVNVGGFMEYFVLQNTRLSLVVNMANVISESVRIAVQNHFSGLKNQGSLD